MPTITATAADFTAGGTPPAGAYLAVARATVDYSGTVVVSTARQLVPFVNGVGTFQVDSGVAYRVQAFGIAGFTEVWFFSTTADTTLTTAYQSLQVDPSDLSPLPTPWTLQAAIGAETARAEAAEVLLAPLVSPALAGTPTAPTAPATANSTQVATTAFVQLLLGNLIGGAPAALNTLVELATAIGNDPNFAADLATQLAGKATVAALAAEVQRAQGAEAALAPLASPVLTGNPTAPTQAPGDASTKLATTAFLAAAITALGLKSAATHAATDFDAAGTAATAAAAVLLHGTPNAITGTATAVGGVRNTVDGTAAAYTVTLPAPAFVGQPLVIERIDTTTANAVTVQGAAGATIEGSTSRVITLAAVGVANESILFVAESTTSWSVAAGHKPGSWIDAYIAQRIATPGSATGTSLAAAYLQLITANSDGSLNFPDTGWGVAADGSPTFYGVGQVPAGQKAYGPVFASDGSAVLIPTGA